MGNVPVVESYVYRLANNHADLVEISCNDEGLVQIGDEGATEFASALAINTTLEVLDLGGMDVGDHGAAALAHALVLNKTLTTLRLHRNKISDEGAEKLVTALRHNHTITALYVAMNVIRKDEFNDEIQRLVAINKLGPEEAAKKKSELYSPGWVAEGAELRRQAEEELSRQEDENTMVAMAVESQQEETDYPSLLCRSSVYAYARGHEKKD